MSDQPKPATGEWTVDTVGELIDNAPEVLSGGLKAVAAAHNAALADAKDCSPIAAENVKLAEQLAAVTKDRDRLQDDWSELFKSELEANRQLAAAEAQDKRHMEKAHKEVMLERRQLAVVTEERDKLIAALKTGFGIPK